MKEFIENLIGRLEEYKDSHLIEHDSEECLHCQENEDDWCNCRDCSICVWDKAVEIVNQLAEEYSVTGGWIPCSERLPEESGEYYTYVYYDGRYMYSIDEIDCDEIIKEWNSSSDYQIIAWKPIATYQPKGE